MKLAIAPQGLFERVAFASGKFPLLPMLSLLGTGFSQIIITGVRLNIFNQMVDMPRTAEEIAGLTDCDAHGMEILLEAMSSFGLLRRTCGTYSLVPETRSWLTRGGKHPGSVEAVRLNAEIGRRFAHLDEYVKTGIVNNIHFATDEDGWWANYLQATEAAAGMALPLIKRLKLRSEPKSLLDI